MDHLGIFYFTSTGNSLYLAKKVQEILGGKIRYIPSYQGNGSEFNRIIIVTPIYSFGLPTPVYDFLQKLNRKSDVVAIQNYGGMVGGADRLFYEYAVHFELNIKGVFTMRMPENYTLVMSPPAFYKNSALRKADKRIFKIASNIGQGKYRIPKKGSTWEKTYLKNKANWHMIGERFSVNEKCVKCKKCVELCPSQNIAFVNGQIEFSNRCIACLGCFHRCPQHAIVYMNKTRKKQYLNPNIDESEIGKDFE